MLSAIIVGCIAAYYFGLRTGAYVAAAAFVLGLVASLLPRYAFTINLALAIGVVVIWRIGSRRPQPADAALAVRFAKRQLARLRAYFAKDRR